MTQRCDAIAWAARHGGCDGCGTPLVGRQQRWCANGCDQLYWQNHRWNQARACALSRARVYGWRRRWVGPLNSDGGVRLAWTHLGHRCAHCGTTTTAPEVNHISPALGRHGQESCIHHQDNLEVLCHDCHLDVTRAQRAARTALAS